MVELNIELPEGFLDEEIRCDYMISADMKKVWAVQLDMLKELERVCSKYGLTYFADSGTLIGAVREKGYIPWDDDIDLVMMRSDYDKLVEVAPTEFKHPYFLQNTYSDKLYIRGHSQLRNSETTGFIPQDADKPFNKGIFVDIFPLDNLPDDEKERKRFIKGINIRWSILVVATYTKYLKTLKGKIAGYALKPFVNMIGYQKLFKKYEQYCSKYNARKTKELSDIAYARGREKNIWETSWYQSAKAVPFEFTTINVPNGYDGRLSKEYGDYMKKSNAPSVHGDCVLDATIPYHEYLKRHGID